MHLRSRWVDSLQRRRVIPVCLKISCACTAVADITFSRDPSQTILTGFGDGGRQPGQFFGVHSIATDSAGNLYTTETFEGKRVQKLVNLGLRPIESADTGVAWPE